MARKFGKKNVIKINPVEYNLGLIGESGIGKTTLAKEVCEKLVGEDGYIIANIGKEDGIDAIAGASYEDIPDWDTFEAFTEDIIKNRSTDYRDLKVIVYDTFDELVRITEPEVIRLHNKENPDKRVKSIKAAFGGYMGGEDKAIELILEKMWELKKVGIYMFILGHTKKRTMTDLVTGIEYDMLTTNMSHRYFNAIKTKLHVLGVASINRQIATESVPQKVGKNKIVGKIVDESRIITFRDDNFNIDSKSRFADIVHSIPLDADLFIEAIENAIKSAFEKQGSKSNIEDVKIEQEKTEKKRVAKAVAEINKGERNVELTEIIKEKFTDADESIKNKIKEIMDEYNIDSLKNVETNPTEALEKMVEVLG